MKSYITAFMLICFASFSSSQTNYNKDWDAVEKLENEGLTKSASELVNKIYSKAKTEKNTQQLIKSLLFQSKYLQVLEEDSQLKIVNNFKADIDTSDIVTKHLLENILANLYWQYYKQNRWKFYNRSKTAAKDDGDFRIWDLDTLFNEIHNYFQCSLDDAEQLQSQDLKDYSELLFEVDGSKDYRPTLYDLLSHNALDFYKTPENNITKPSYKFTIDSQDYIGTSDVFSKLNITSKDSTNLQLNALKIYQNLIRFHQNDKSSNAFVAVNIERLNFVKQHSTFGNAEDAFIKTLQIEDRDTNGKSSSALYNYEIANLLHQKGSKYNAKKPESETYRWHTKEALQICESVIKEHPKSSGAKKCETLKALILKPDLGLITEKHVPLNSESLILVNYKNLDALTFNIYKVSFNQLKKYKSTYRADEREKFIKKLDVHKTFSSTLINEKDYQVHSLEVVLPALDNGLYLVVAKTETDVFSTADIQVTDMALIETQETSSITYQLVNRNNGKPISGASVKLHYRSKRNVEKELGSRYTTDDKGQFKFNKNNNNYYSVYATVKKGNETAIFGESYINRLYNKAEKNTIDYKTFIITDRSIYRPGQTVYFKGITTQTRDKNTTVLVDEVITATLHDVNGQELGKQEFKTNEYGSFHGEFILPNSGLTGNFRIETNSDKTGAHTHYFSVEEYKRPKFETNFDPITESYKINDSITVHGKAIAFAGSNITDAKVVYRVKRQVQFPNWYYWRGSFNSEAQEITFGESLTDSDGKFEIKFKALPDDSVSKENLPIFTYEVTADVTDLNGETRSATTTVNVGYHSLLATVNVPNRLDKSLRDNQISISTTNLNNEFIPAKGTLKIYKLSAPNQVLRPRPWEAPDYKLLSKESFKSQFPNWAYENESDFRNWQNGDLVFDTDFDTEVSKIIDLKRMTRWESGKYRIELESEDKFGQAVKDKSFFDVYSNTDKALADQSFFDISLDKDEYNPNENARLTFGTASTNATVTLRIEKEGKIINTQVHALDDNRKSIELPITNKDLGGFVVHYSFVTLNSIQTSSVFVNVPYRSTDLQIETSTFRDKLQPGQDETWSFKVKGPKGDKVTAEVLASMYDASLDEFKSGDWSFNPIYRSNYRQRSNTNTSKSFSTVNFRRFNNFKRVPYYAHQKFDRLDWFGLYFGNEQYLRRQYLRRKSGKKSIAKTSYDSSINKDSIIGTVLDYEGLALPGVNVILKGTTTGISTDFDGKFKLKAKKGNTLQFSFLGFKPLEHIIDKDNVINVMLAEDDAMLDEVVITGYATTSKAKSSVSSVRVEDEELLELNESAELNADVEQTLSGQVPGLNLIAGSGEPGKTNDEGINNNSIQIRKNLNETAFSFPQLTTDVEGNVSFNFKAPEALTQWKLQLLAHTKTLESSVAQFEAVTQKELMVIPNAPRFLREGDEIVISTKIANISNKNLNGTARLELTDAVTGNSFSAEIINSDLDQAFDLSAKGNTNVNWTLNIPENIQAIQYIVTAQSEDFSDGEQNVLPVLTNRMLVTETLPMWIKSNETRTFTLDKLANTTSQTLKHHKLTLEVTSNPAWYAVQALPYLMEYPYDCNEQTFSRYYANALAQHISKSNPKIEAVFNQWKSKDALISNLEKNEDLKSLLIQETPWLRDAQNETEQKKRIALLFDLNKMNNELQSALRKLQNNQHDTGAWPWFNGGYDNRYITQHIIGGFGHLKQLSVSSTGDERQMIEKAINYLDKQFIKEYEDLKRYGDVDLSKDHLSHTQLHYLYVRSFFPEFGKTKALSKIEDYYRGQIKSYWLKRSLYAKGLMALVMQRNDDSTTANKILKSLKENSITSEELGMYWKENTASWYWHQAPIETQALIIEAFSEIKDDIEVVDNLKIWLLKNKQTNKWSTTKATAEAVYALLLQGSDWLSVTDVVEVTVGNENIDPNALDNVSVEAGTGYYKTSWNGKDVSSEQSKVTMSKKGDGITWGALYWQYFEDLDKITSAETPLKLKKKLFLKRNTDRGEEISEITENTKLNLGDLVRVRIELRSDRNMEFLHLKDMRASGFEPVNVISRYKWQDGLGYYESTKDAATNFFIDYLPKGVYVFEYDLRVNNAGDMSNGITTIQSMYAPEFSSHSEGVRVTIE